MGQNVCDLSFQGVPTDLRTLAVATMPVHRETITTADPLYISSETFLRAEAAMVAQERKLKVYQRGSAGLA